ncbi:protein SEMI-ROLLED LEAF 2-like isoform X1 [Arachis stenosperma]|uniref:protein SEMI-ROLLED LEAF 2-like isoform X1 n=2 Tax=Arachis stenosperma TaxID=217475 RepID=UPI0025AC4797|nr:protein SEMI-ROLLED LEAF 2-like isoform X1 [Arachis stenosperma]XP_057728913.1 protein SEMI-ROLLED LEAF 2-like isoform X1 [Arachis stenosperma]
MGVMSRRVLPVCGNLCVFCPSLRPRSRQPVKRYKKLIADIFPRNQVPEPNDRKIGKLCDYISRNPLRIPKITDNLEQRFYKDLRNENLASVNVVLCIYKKLLSSCKEQTPLFANSLLGIIRTLLEQTQADELRILGCNTLVGFIDCQTDGRYMFNLEGFIPKLCQMAQEVGDDDRALLLRSAGLQALSCMVQFMGEHSHLSMDLDKIISVVLENYMDLQSTSNVAAVEKLDLQSQNQLAQGFPKEADGGHSLPDISTKNSSSLTRTEMESKLDTTKDPTYWSKLCLYNMAKLAKEATTVRRVLEPLFHNFDIENHWSSQKGVASSVLTYLQTLLAESGDNSHLLLSILVKHLDHKNVAKQPILQIDIINTTTHLAQNVKPQSSVAIIGAISDLIKHLRKCLQSSAESSSVGSDAYKLNIELQSAIERCILQLSNKVGDVGPILDLMAVVLENISTSTLIARTTISAVYQTAKLISSVPNVSYQKKAFPDALFHQLLVAMAHPDRETQIGAHSVFSMVLMPSMVSPWLDQKTKMAMKVQSNSFHIQNDSFSEAEHLNGKLLEGNTVAGVTGDKNAVHPYRGYSFTRALTDGKEDLGSLRLSSHQVSLLLSSIWVQATSVENGPANFEAMAHTFSISLLFTRSKASNYRVLARCFQLAFSLRSISLDQEGGLQPTRRRSLFTLASYMLMFSARAGNFPDLIPKVKSSLTEATVDPFLKLVDDIRLQAVCIESEKTIYGSQEDEIAAINSLSAVESDDEQLKETVISYFTIKFSKLSKDELSNIKTQILQGFSVDEAYPSGPSLFMETPGQFSPRDQIEFPDFDEIETSKFSIGEESGPEPSGSQSDRRTSLSTNTADVLSVNQLLESVTETARQVASFSISSNPLPYDQMKDQCEALVNGKQEKMSVLQSFKHRSDVKAIVLPSERGVEVPPLPTKVQNLLQDDLKLVSQEQSISQDQVLVQQNSLRLPPSSPYDKFLRAAGC